MREVRNPPSEPDSVDYDLTPTMERFFQSQALVRCIMGPYGSGKTVCCLMRIVALARTQEPDKNGIRPTKTLVTRNTYNDLLRTTVETFKDWFCLNGLYTLKGSQNPEAHAYYPLDDGTYVDHTIIFMPLKADDDVGKTKSFEFTNAFINEGSEMHKKFISAIISRLGRFPPEKRVSATERCLLVDTNPPSNSNWYYEKAETERPDNWDFFSQPPALLRAPRSRRGYIPNPEAENVNHLGPGYEYYFAMVEACTYEEIKCRVLGEYSTFYSGQPVYPEYSDREFSQEEPLEILRGLPVFLGWDFGNTPACMIGQLAPNGQLRFLREHWMDSGSLVELAKRFVLPDLKNTFTMLRVVSFADPSGGNKGQTYFETPIDVLTDMGIPTTAAPCAGNRPEDRISALRGFFSKVVWDITGKKLPGVLVDRSCKRFRDALKGGYLRKAVNTSVGGDFFSEKPEKNKFSHIAEAGQYLAVGVREPDGRREYEATTPMSSGKLANALF